jgi:23S rRNA (guanosine2251-2'-O)-methyltransferase
MSFWIGGKHTVTEALNNPKRNTKEVIVLDERRKEFLINNTKFKNIKINNQKFFKKIFLDEMIHQGYAAYIEETEKKNIINDLNNGLLENNIILLDEITDPRNVGSIIRTAVAFNIKSILVKKRNFNSKSSAMYKAASGCMEKIKIYETINLANILTKLKQNNYFLTGLDSHSNYFFDNKTKFYSKNIFVFGSEEFGMRNLTKKMCDQLIKIRISQEVESMNVSNSVASFLTLYRFTH